MDVRFSDTCINHKATVIDSFSMNALGCGVSLKENVIKIKKQCTAQIPHTFRQRQNVLRLTSSITNRFLKFWKIPKPTFTNF